jgi:hypothetical protein
MVVGFTMTYAATFNNIAVISRLCFIGGGNRSAWRKPLTYYKLHNVASYERDSNPQLNTITPLTPINY